MKLTANQRKRIYQYWREKGLPPKEAAKRRNSIEKVFYDFDVRKRMGLLKKEEQLKHVRLTPTQKKEIKKNISVTGIDISSIKFSSRDQERQFLMNLKKYNKMLGQNAKERSKVVKENKKLLQSATSERAIYEAMQSGYKNGLQPLIIKDAKGRTVLRI